MESGREIPPPRPRGRVPRVRLRPGRACGGIIVPGVWQAARGAVDCAGGKHARHAEAKSPQSDQMGRRGAHRASGVGIGCERVGFRGPRRRDRAQRLGDGRRVWGVDPMDARERGNRLLGKRLRHAPSVQVGLFVGIGLGRHGIPLRALAPGPPLSPRHRRGMEGGREIPPPRPRGRVPRVRIRPGRACGGRGVPGVRGRGWRGQGSCLTTRGATHAIKVREGVGHGAWSTGKVDHATHRPPLASLAAGGVPGRAGVDTPSARPLPGINARMRVKLPFARGRLPRAGGRSAGLRGRSPRARGNVFRARGQLPRAGERLSRARGRFPRAPENLPRARGEHFCALSSPRPP